MSASEYSARFFNQAYMSLVAPTLIPTTHRGLRGRMRELDRREGMSPDQNRDLQWQSVKRLVQHAYDTTPFYKRRFDEAGVQPSRITSPVDFASIPALTRDDIRMHLEDMWSRRYKREELLSAATGGTTDTPIRLLRSPECVPEKVGVQLKFDTWAGMWPGDKVFYLWGARQDYSENPSWRWRLYDRYLMRRIWAPTSLLSEKVLEQYRQTLNHFRPRAIYAYPSPLALFCEYLLSCGRPCHRPRSAICTAEPLLPAQRRTIETALGCAVFERYGARDFGMIAAECERHRGMHLNPLAAYVEFQRVDKSETEGLCELLVTDLLNYGMPLIRYKVNDCTLLPAGNCRCGRGYPLIGQIIGRTTDNFRLPSGDVVPGVSLTNRVIQVCPGIRKLQVIQETLESFRIRFVAGDGFSQDDLKNLGKKLQVFLGQSVKWNFEQTEEIERESSGKTRLCISRLSEALGENAREKQRRN